SARYPVDAGADAVSTAAASNSGPATVTTTCLILIWPSFLGRRDKSRRAHRPNLVVVTLRRRSNRCLIAVRQAAIPFLRLRSRLVELRTPAAAPKSWKPTIFRRRGRARPELEARGRRRSLSVSGA